MHCCIFFGMTHLNQALDTPYCCYLHLTGCLHQCYFTGWRKTQPRLLFWLETSCWLMVLVFFKHPVSQLWRKGSCFVATSVSRTAGCLQKKRRRRRKKMILQFDLQWARLQRSFAAGDPDTVIKSDQRQITPVFLFFLLPPYSSPNSPMTEHSPLCIRLLSMTERLWWTAWRWSIISPQLMISKLIWDWTQRKAEAAAWMMASFQQRMDLSSHSFLHIWP